MQRAWLARSAIAVGAIVILSGSMTSCTGRVEEPWAVQREEAQSPSPSTPEPSEGPAAEDEPVIPRTGGLPGPQLPSGAAALSDSPQLRLRAPRELVAVLRQVLGVSVEESEFPRLQSVDGNGNIAPAQGVGYAEVEAYYRAAERIADRAVDRLEDECDLESECATVWLRSTLARLFSSRGGETDTFMGLLDAPDAGSNRKEAVSAVLIAALSSPQFLYRPEVGSGAERLRSLSGPEIAVRLANLVWDSVPDATLLATADRLTDPEVRAGQLVRMLDDARAERGLTAFVRDWFGTDAATVSSKDAEVLEGTPPTLGRSADESLDRMIARVLLEDEKSYLGLLTSDTFFIDQSLSDALQLEAGGAEGFEPVSVGPERRGVLTHPRVVAAHTKESGLSPFLMGEFLMTNLLCQRIPSPPAIPEVDESEIQGATFRERLEWQTRAPACNTCHRFIGPPGFAFLSFDPIGRYQPNDPLGRPYDTSGVLPLAEQDLSFANAPELSRGLAESDDVARCLARRLFRWTYGHFEGDADQAEAARLETVVIRTRGAVQETLSEIVRSPRFAQVRVEGP